jgi:uncharacterized protein YggT (Ycf19 family)
MEHTETNYVRDESSGTVREESTVTDDSGPAPVRQASVVKSSAPARRVTEAIYLVFGIVDAFLLIRLALKLLAANPQAGFASFIYGVTDFFLAPFHGLLPTVVSGKSVLELSLLIAILIYSLVAIGLARIVDITMARNVTVSHQSRSEGLKPHTD